MSATPSPPTADSCPKLLADVLYAKEDTNRVTEADWVDLVRRITDHDERALRELYERSHRLVFTLAIRITRSRESAEEVTLDVFQGVWLRAPQYDVGTGTVLAWIMNQARSRSIDRLRFEQRRKRADPHPGESPLENAETDVGALSDAYNHSQMHAALGTLTIGERQAIEAAFFRELTHAEVAAALREPLGTIKTRIRSGMAKLRQALACKGQQP